MIGESGFGGIHSVGDANKAVGWCQSRSVEQNPFRPYKGLKTRVKIRWLQLVGVPGKIPGRDLKRPAKKDAQMCKIPADTLLADQDIDRRTVLVGHSGCISDIFIDPVCDAAYRRISIFVTSELVLGKPEDLIGRTITAGK